MRARGSLLCIKRGIPYYVWGYSPLSHVVRCWHCSNLLQGSLHSSLHVAWCISTLGAETRWVEHWVLAGLRHPIKHSDVDTHRFLPDRLPRLRQPIQNSKVETQLGLALCVRWTAATDKRQCCGHPWVVTQFFKDRLCFSLLALVAPQARRLHDPCCTRGMCVVGFRSSARTLPLGVTSRPAMVSGLWQTRFFRKDVFRERLST